jgi:uracil-DNA glycosylase family protein
VAICLEGERGSNVASGREMASRRSSPPGAEAYLPDRRTIPLLQRKVHECRGCDLYRHATQAVFGEGPPDARVVFVGEQPGNAEDLAGHPFVGPAGRVFDKALAAAGIDRRAVYVTNAVKHFKFEERGKARLHKRPRPGEVRACAPWLRAELDVIHPEVLVLLGGTAAQSLLGASFRVTQERGKPIPSELARVVIATVHPSSILRAPDSEAREAAFASLVSDLEVVAKALRRRSRASAARKA